MFDVDQLIADCQAAVADAEPRLAVKAVLSEYLAQPGEIADALQPSTAGFTPLHVSGDLTVLHVVWAPKMTIYPHNHLMWAAIGIYAGQEDNTLFRRDDDGTTIVESGGRELSTGEVLLLGDDVIHGVSNPRAQLTGAIHVYGGDLINTPRSQWGPGPLVERPYDVEQAQREFTLANDAWLSSPEA